MKKLFSLILVSAMVVSSFTACSKPPASNTEQPAADKTTTADSGAEKPATENAKSNDISAYHASSPESLDPTIQSSLDGATYIVNMMQGLYRYKWDGTGVELGDAESVETSEDGLTWTFKLRPDIKWSDGKPVTAKDYEYTWKRMCDPETGGTYSGDLAPFIKNGIEAYEGKVSVDEVAVKAIDDLTFEVVLASPCPFFDEIAVFPSFYPVREDVVSADPEGWWTKAETYITNGPFKVKHYKPLEELALIPNENYYDKDKIKPTSLTFKFYADESVALTNFRKGSIDLLYKAPPSEVDALKAEGVYELRPQLGTYYISFNTTKAPFDNPSVRKALSLAIDRKYISEQIMKGVYTPITGMVGPGFQDAEPGTDFRTVGGDYISSDYEENKKLAKEALVAAGYPDGKDFPVFEYMYNESNIHKPIAEVMQKNWEEVLGIKVNLVSQEWNVFLDNRRKGNYEACRDGWVSDWNDPSSMLTIFNSNSGNNNSQYKNPEFDNLLKKSSSTFDQKVRMEALHAAEKVLMEQSVVAPLLNYGSDFVVSKSLKNWNYTPVGYTFYQLATKE